MAQAPVTAPTPAAVAPAVSPTQSPRHDFGKDKAAREAKPVITNMSAGKKATGENEAAKKARKDEIKKRRGIK